VIGASTAGSRRPARKQPSTSITSCLERLAARRHSRTWRSRASRVRSGKEHGPRTTAIDPASGDAIRLFHPRVEAWTEHFRADASGEITGLTAIGRATVVALSMNRVLAIRIRHEEHSRERWP
jgi:hypothetical protein